MIKAIIFDLGSVLIGGNWRAVYRIIAKKLKISRKKLLETIMPLLEKWNKGKIDERKFWQEVEKRIGKRLPREFKKDLWYRTYIEKRPDIKESWKILPELKKRKFRLALLSNTIPPHVKANKKIGRFNKLKKLGFETFVLSCEVGTRKPEPKIYKIILKRLNLPAKECVFVDDKLENIHTSKKLGMKGVHYKTPKQLRKDLIKLGLL